MEDNSILFENSFTPTREDIREYVVHLLPKRSLFIFFTAFGALALLFFIWWQLSLAGILVHQFVHIIVAVILVVAVMHIDRYLKRTAVNRLEKRYIAQNGGQLTQITTLFYQDRLECNGKAHNYLDFAEVHYGEECLYLVTRDKQVVMVKDLAKPDSDESDSPPIWNFLNGKCKGLHTLKKDNGLGLSFFTR